MFFYWFGMILLYDYAFTEIDIKKNDFFLLVLGI